MDPTAELTTALGWTAAPTAPSQVTAGEGESTDLASADDRVLVAAFQAGHAAAFDVIVTRHQRHVYRICYRFMHNHDDAADLAQDTFVRAHRGLARFKGDAALATWLYRIAVNTCLNRLERKRPVMEYIDAAPRIDTRE